MVLQSRLARRSVQTYENLSIFSIFSRLGPFPQVFAQVKEWLMLKLQKIIRVSRAVACPIVFILTFDGGWHGVLKVMKNDYVLVFFAVCVLFPKFFCR